MRFLCAATRYAYPDNNPTNELRSFMCTRDLAHDGDHEGYALGGPKIPHPRAITLTWTDDDPGTRPSPGPPPGCPVPELHGGCGSCGFDDLPVVYYETSNHGDYEWDFDSWYAPLCRFCASTLVGRTVTLRSGYEKNAVVLQTIAYGVNFILRAINDRRDDDAGS